MNNDGQSNEIVNNAQQMGDLIGEIQYCYWFSFANSIFYGLLDGFFNFVQILSGTSVFASTLADMPTLSKFSALTVAVVSILSLLIKPSECQFSHRTAYQKFLKLEAKAFSFQANELKLKIRRMQGEFHPGLNIFDKPAYNRACQYNNLTDNLFKLSWLERLADKVF